MTDQRAICVTGAHRSGTSMIASVLLDLGMSPGAPDQLLESAPDNPLGFFEYKPFVEINDEILKRFGGSWQDLPALPEHFETDPVLSDLRQRATELLDRDFSEAPAWMFKDPRTSLTLPFWQQLLSDLRSADLRFIVCLRNPLSVATSLHARNELSLERGLDLWLGYTRAALHNTRGNPRILVPYERCFEEPDRMIERIARLAGCEPDDDQRQRARARFDQEHWNNRQPLTNLLEHSPSEAILGALYEALSLAGDAERPDDAAMARLVDYCGDAVQRGRQYQRDGAAERAALATEVGALNEHREAERHSFSGERNAWDDERQHLVATRDEALRRVDSAHRSIGELRSELQARSSRLLMISNELSASRHRRRAAEHRAEVAENERNGLTDLVTALKSELEALLSSRAWRLTKPLRSARTLAGRAKALLAPERAPNDDLARAPAAPSDARVDSEYERWLRAHHDDDAGCAPLIQARIAELGQRPSISVIMPVFDPEPRWLRRAIDSVVAQHYPSWELCIADDCSTNPEIRRILGEYSGGDERIRVTYREQNGHISAASNTAVDMAKGDFVALLDHDDDLDPKALYLIAEAINDAPESDVLYSDEDKIDADGVRCEPHFKPEPNLELLRSYNFVSHLGVYRRDLVNRIGGFRLGYEGAQDYDLLLRALDDGAVLTHVPHVLYHWRQTDRSTASGVARKGYAHDAGRRAIQAHLDRSEPGAECQRLPGHHGWYRSHYPTGSEAPMVSIIIPTRDRFELLSQAVMSILEKTDYPSFEIVIVDNQSVEATTLTFLSQIAGHPRVRVLSYEGPFNFSSINNYAVSQTESPVIALVNNDVEVIAGGWLRELVSHAIRPTVGCAGAKLYYPDDTIQHAGVIIGLGGVAGHSHKGRRRSDPGYQGRLLVAQNLSAVTAACLAMRRDVYTEVGGLDERLAVAFNDVDLCLKVRKAGYSIVWTPYAELYHHESASRGYEDSPEKRSRFEAEVSLMKGRWGETLIEDPAYSPNLTRDAEDFGLAYPPRVERPWEQSSRDVA